MDYSFFWLPSLTRKRFPLVNWLDPSLKKVMKYFVVSLDKKFGCNVMNVCLLSWLGHTLALWFAKQDFLNKMTHRPSKAVSKNEKKSICKQFLGGHVTDIDKFINIFIAKNPLKPRFFFACGELNLKLMHSLQYSLNNCDRFCLKVSS